jgi:hypothetical protein
MTVIGESANWGDLFPTHFLPDIFDLLIETWERFEKPARDAQEPLITRRFRSALIQAKRYKVIPFLIMREDVEDDFESGEEIGRKDIAFYPTHHEEAYFAFECKRLNALVGGKLRALAAEYVSDGMSRYVTTQYARFMSHGGMIGYVLDGRCQHAMALVEQNIQSRYGDLKMKAPGNFLPSTFRAESPVMRETAHELPRPFRLHHIFLACPAAETDEG